MKWKCQSLSHIWLFVTPWTVVRRILCLWNSPSRNTGVGSYFLLRVIFLTPGLNPGLLQCRQTVYHLTHQGSPWPCKGCIIFISWRRLNSHHGSRSLILATGPQSHCPTTLIWGIFWGSALPCSHCVLYEPQPHPLLPGARHRWAAYLAWSFSGPFVWDSSAGCLVLSLAVTASRPFTWKDHSPCLHTAPSLSLLWGRSLLWSLCRPGRLWP